tara:strand:- start:696 stop:1412 length:717 start_codon:yes stop_codon:yes gene_type:complete
MIPLLLTKLLGSKNWYIDDNPQLFRGIVQDPHELATWEDVEYCINNPQFYDIKFIHKEILEWVDIPKHQRCWANDSEDVKELIQVWKDGHNLVINNFDSGFRKKQEILQLFEKTFDGRMAMHIYAGYKGCSSFRVHEDTANNFIIQIEGETHWTVYNNKCSNIIKPQEMQSPEEFNDLVKQMVPAIDTMLTPGDMIYIPARCYHQAQPNGKRLSVSIPMQHMLPHLKPFDRTYHALPH